MRILIIGAGPAGVAAAHRLHELGESNWHLYEATDAAGGRAQPVRSGGFTYDMGHRIDLRHPYIDRLMRNTLGNTIMPAPMRDAMVVAGQVVPMPLHEHLRLLEPELLVDCIMGLARLPVRQANPQHLQAWLRASFGEALSRRILEPYLRKYWAHPLDLMDAAWAPAQMPPIELEVMLRAIIEDAAAAPEPQSPMQPGIYPSGGTAEPFERIAAGLARHISFGSPVAEVDPRRRVIRLANGLEDHYDAILSTMPLSDLVSLVRGAPPRARSATLQLAASSARMLGIGFRGPLVLPAERIHFSDSALPFSRVTHLTALSPAMAPDGHSSIVVEASASNWDAAPGSSDAETTLASLVEIGILPADAAARVADHTAFEIPCARPTPTIDRDVALELIHPYLLSEQIYSRGLSGSWMHEAGDLDRSMMQGVEAIDRILVGTPERTWPEPALRRMEALR